LTWLSLALSLIRGLGAFLSYLYEQSLIRSGEANEAAALLNAQANSLQGAIAAREAVDSDLARNPERLSDDDGFRRKE
jgi:hypothetical protein